MKDFKYILILKCKCGYEIRIPSINKRLNKKANHFIINNGFRDPYMCSRNENGKIIKRNSHKFFKTIKIKK